MLAVYMCEGHGNTQHVLSPDCVPGSESCTLINSSSPHFYKVTALTVPVLQMEKMRVKGRTYDCMRSPSWYVTQLGWNAGHSAPCLSGMEAEDGAGAAAGLTEGCG